MFNKAYELIKKSGDRATFNRVKVLAFLLSQQSAVTHHQIEECLDSTEKIDRVTLYRVLDWLTIKGLVHKFVSGDRVWRFRANMQESSLHQHAHFKCQECSEVICLEDVHVTYDIPLPEGYQAKQTELTVNGTCARCA